MARRLWDSLAILCLAASLAGCSAGRDRELRQLIAQCEFSRAAGRIELTMEADRKSRDYMLDRMSLGIVKLADGRLRQAEEPLLEVFDVLRTQGVNDDRTMAAAVFGEGGVIYWKGEPFEQALAFTYIAVQRAARGEWDNARAAGASSLFLLTDFGVNEGGRRKSAQEIAREAARRDAVEGDDDYIDRGYTPVPTNFALGYFLTGVANLAMAEGDPAREDEARDHFREAFELNADLRPVADALVSRRANTVLVVDYGLGPRKIRYGPDGTLTTFSPITPSDSRRLDVRVGSGALQSFPVACDVNAMASDHRWKNLEDLRKAKSALGTGMMFGGAITAAASRNETGQLVGLGLLLGGLLTRSTAQADIRHCEALPQRTYLVAIDLPPGGAAVSLSIGGEPTSHLVIPAMPGPEAGRPLAVYYVRLPYPRTPLAWASAGRVRYGNDVAGGAAPGDELPWILGGTCVRLPCSESLSRYQQAGNLLGMTTADLENLYRLEGIVFEEPAPTGIEGMHILEGGRWLGPPDAGSTGFVRLFCSWRSPYQPRSEEVRALAEAIAASRAAAP